MTRSCATAILHFLLQLQRSALGCAMPVPHPRRCSLQCICVSWLCVYCVCICMQWLFGRDLQRAVQPPRPIGLIEASLGGTPIQDWSSADALDTPCSVERLTGDRHTRNTGPARAVTVDQAAAETEQGEKAANGNGGLWNGLIAPLLRSSIRGAIWCKQTTSTSSSSHTRTHASCVNGR